MASRSHRRRGDVLVVAAPSSGKRRPSKRAAADWSDLIEDLEVDRERRRKSGMLYRLRRQLAPWVAAVGLAGWVGLCWLYGAAPVFGWSCTLVGLGACAGFGLFFRRVAPLWRKRLIVAGALASVWMGAAIAAGPSWDAMLALAVLTVGMSLRWWRHHRIGYPTGPVVDASPDYGIVERWSRYVASQTGPLPGSWLSNRKAAKNGETYVANLDPGKHSLTTALGQLDRIASGLDVPIRRLMLEQYKGEGEESPNKLTLAVVRNSPVEKTVTYPGPSYANGIVDLGPYADGEGLAPWRLWTPGEIPHSGSMWGGAIIGGSGSGKSRLIETLAIAAMSTGCFVVWFIDPQEGASSPDLAEHADWYTDGSGALDMLDSLEFVAAKRAKENAARRFTGFDPTPARPGIFVIVDEAHEIFGDPRKIVRRIDGKPMTGTDRWAELARKVRKVGIGIVAASQYPGLVTFGNSEPLRAQVMKGNRVVLHAASKQNAQLMPGLTVDPLTLPDDLPGFGYTIQSSGFARTAPYRGYYVADPAARMQKLDKPKLDELSAKAAGEAYTDRVARAKAASDALLQELGLAPEPVPLTLSDGTVLPAPSFPAPPAELADLSRTAVVAVPDLTGAQARVWDALGREERTWRELVEATGWSETRLNDVLRELRDAGHVDRVARGRYRRARGAS